MTKRTTLLLPAIGRFVAAACFGIMPMLALAQAYPSKPVRVVVPYPPGGPTDIAARIVAQKLSENMRQSFVVENRPGATGMIGTDLVAKATPDGYTLLVNASVQVIYPSLFAKMAFDPIKDFSPVTVLAQGPLVLLVNPDLPVKSVKDLVALAKSKPGKLQFGSSGNGAATHLSAEAFKILAGVDMQHITYKGSTPALTDVMGGHVQLMFDSMSSSLPFIKAGKLRALAVTTAVRSPAMPDLPTIAEAGVPGYDLSTWYGLWAPAGTPKDIVSKLSTEVAKILKTPEVREKLAALGSEPVGNSPDEFATFSRIEQVKWAKVVRESGAKLD
ncbi:MAG: tripartite tricarboxylate transporter substrate binding protein [Pseudomonadota bacterium]